MDERRFCVRFEVAQCHVRVVRFTVLLLAVCEECSVEDQCVCVGLERACHIYICNFMCMYMNMRERECVCVYYIYIYIYIYI
jgi:hypothetical protein